MATKQAQKSALKGAWSSKIGKKTVWLMMLVTFGLCLIVGTGVRHHEVKDRDATMAAFAQSLAATVLSGGADDAEMIVLKVNDLVNVEAVLGVRLLAGADVPLQVGEISSTFPEIDAPFDELISQGQGHVEVALALPPALPFNWLVVRLDSEELVQPPYLGSVINWLVAPVFAGLVGLVYLWASGRFFVAPLGELNGFLKDHADNFSVTALPAELQKRDDDVGLLAAHLETVRIKTLDGQTKLEDQTRFLHETPDPLMRCSVNRKVLYANVAARAYSVLFGDETKEFVSAPVAELIRRAFQENGEVRGDVRLGEQSLRLRAIAVLDAGYVNLYGEGLRSS